ncbi:MAG: bacteriophage holin [Haloechinothrix sp.]
MTTLGPTPYLLSVVLVIVGLLVLALVLFRTYRNVRTVKALADAVNAVISNERGLLLARSAALRVALNQRRRKAPGG